MEFHRDEMNDEPESLAETEVNDKPASGAKSPKAHAGKKHRGRMYAFGAVILLLIIGAAMAFPKTKNIDEELPAGGASTTIARPDGDPSGQSAEDNLYICMGVMAQETYRSRTTGTADAKIGFINYTQKIKNERVVTADSVFTEAVSTSALKKMGEQKYYKNGAILVRYADSVSGDGTAAWGESIVGISKEDCEAAYGQDPRNLTNYVVSRDTVQNAVMEKKADGSYAVTFDLEPEGASAYYKRQVRTYGGATNYPIFHSVHMVWTMNSNWDLMEMDTVENYDIVMSGIGSPNCTGSLKEVFSDFGTAADTHTEFQKYLKEDYDPRHLGKLKESDDTAKEIEEMFARAPDYKVSLTANGKTYPLLVHIDAANRTFQARGTVEGVSVFAAYSGERLYLHAGSQKIILRAADTLDAFRMAAGVMGVNIPNISLNSDALQSLTNSVQMTETEGGMTVKLNDSLVSGTVILKNDKALSLTKAELRLNLGGQSVGVYAVPGSGFKTEELSGYNDLTGALSLVSPIMNAVNAQSYILDVEISGGVSLGGRAIINRRAGGFDVSLTAQTCGVTVTAEYINNTFYVSAGNIHISGTTEQLKSMVASVMRMAGADAAAESTANGYVQFFRELTPQSAVNSVKSLKWSGGTLYAGLNIAGNNVSGALTASSVTVDASGWHIKAALSSSSKSAMPVKPTAGTYITLTQLKPFLATIERYAGSKAMDMAADISVNGYKLHTDMVICGGSTLSARAKSQVLGKDLTVTLYNDCVYIVFGAVQVKAPAAAMAKTMETMLRFMPGIDGRTVSQTVEAYEYFFTHLSLTGIVGAISEMRYSGGAIFITANIAATPLSITMTPNIISMQQQVDTATLTVNAVPGTSYASAPDLVPAGNFTDLDNALSLLSGWGF